MFAISKNAASLPSGAPDKIIARRSRACTIECPSPRCKRHRDHGHQGSGVDYRPRNWAGNRHQANWQRAAKMLGGCRPPILDHVLPRRHLARAVAPATARGTRGAARQFPHRLPTCVEVCDVEGARRLACALGDVAQQQQQPVGEVGLQHRRGRADCPAPNRKWGRSAARAISSERRADYGRCLPGWVAEIGAQRADVFVEVHPGARPPDQGIDGKAVSQIMYARAHGSGANADVDGDLPSRQVPLHPTASRRWVATRPSVTASVHGRAREPSSSPASARLSPAAA